MTGTMLHFRVPTADSGVDDLLEQGLTSTDWLQAGGILLGAIAVAITANRIARAIVSRSLGAGFGAIITARIIGYLIFLVGLVYALNTLGVRVGPLLGALGLTVPVASGEPGFDVTITGPGGTFTARASA